MEIQFAKFDLHISSRLFFIHLMLFFESMWFVVHCTVVKQTNCYITLKIVLKKFAFLCILTMMNGVYLETPKLLRDVVVYRTVLFLLF